MCCITVLWLLILLYAAGLGCFVDFVAFGLICVFSGCWELCSVVVYLVLVLWCCLLSLETWWFGFTACVWCFMFVGLVAGLADWLFGFGYCCAVCRFAFRLVLAVCCCLWVGLWVGCCGWFVCG